VCAIRSTIEIEEPLNIEFLIIYAKGNLKNPDPRSGPANSMPNPSRNEKVIPLFQSHRLDAGVKLAGDSPFEFIVRYIDPDAIVQRDEQFISAEMSLKAYLLPSINSKHAHRTTLGRREHLSRSPWPLNIPIDRGCGP